MIDSIEELRTFQMVAEKGSLSAAARSQGLTVNAVSRRLSALEDRLGVSLAERTTRSFRLTDEGQRFLAHCVRILTEVDDALEELSPTHRGLTGLVRAMVHPAMVEMGFLERLESLLEEHPHLSVHLLTRNSPHDLIREGADLAVWPGEVSLQSVVARRVATVSWVLACSPRYAYKRGVPEKPSDLENHTCLRALRARPERTWVLRDKQGQHHEVIPGGRLDCDDTETLRAALYAGVGIGLRPRGEVVRASASGQLIQVLPGFSFQTIVVHLVSIPGRLRLARVRTMAGVLEQAIASMN